MRYIPLMIGLLPTVLLLLCGIAIKHYKAYWLISGYNTMSAEKKKNVDIQNLGELMANFCYVMSGVILVGTLLMSLNQMVAGGIVLFLILPTSIYMIIKSQKYDGNTRKPDGTMKTRSKILIGAVIGLLVITSAGVCALLYFSNKPTEFFIQDGALRISGLYGEEVELSGITSITSKEQMPKILSKRNGSALGSKMKGYFNLKEIGQAKLFVDTKKPPFIFIEGKSGLRIVNADNPTNTKILYETLLEAWKQNTAAATSLDITKASRVVLLDSEGKEMLDTEDARILSILNGYLQGMNQEKDSLEYSVLVDFGFKEMITSSDGKQARFVILKKESEG